MVEDSSDNFANAQFMYPKIGSALSLADDCASLQHVFEYFFIYFE